MESKPSAAESLAGKASRQKLKPKSLRAARDFECLRKNGRYFHPTRWLMVNYLFHPGAEIRFAWTISANTAPSVVRNRFKRWGREFFRNWPAAPPQGLDFNMIFKKQDKAFYKNLEHKEFNQVLKKVVSRFEKS